MTKNAKLFAVVTYTQVSAAFVHRKSSTQHPPLGRGSEKPLFWICLILLWGAELSAVEGNDFRNGFFKPTASQIDTECGAAAIVIPINNSKPDFELFMVFK